jgi:hypothetical protein
MNRPISFGNRVGSLAEARDIVIPDLIRDPSTRKRELP